MRKVILYIGASLDGYIADSHGGVAWMNGWEEEDGADNGYEMFLRGIDTVLMGYRTYRQVVTELSPDRWVYEGLDTYVFTHKKEETTRRDIHFLDASVSDLVQRLKKQPGKDIWLCGGADLVEQCLQQDLVEEIHLTTIPILLGRGIRLFPQMNRPIHFRLVSSQVKNGMSESIYRKLP